jgi:hypothetical protein
MSSFTDVLALRGADSQSPVVASLLGVLFIGLGVFALVRRRWLWLHWTGMGMPDEPPGPGEPQRWVYLLSGIAVPAAFVVVGCVALVTGVLGE